MLVRFIRTHIARIENLISRGFSVEEVCKQLEPTRGQEINKRSFETSLYRVRKERKAKEQRKENCIVQSNSSTSVTPAPYEQETPLVQPEVERDNFSTVEQAASEAEVVAPWKPPKKKINPHLLALQKKQEEGKA